MDPCPCVSFSDSFLTINWGPSQNVFHFIWLRDNCICSECIHPTSKQKLNSSASIALDIKPAKYAVGNSITILWSDGHDSEYSFPFLKKYAYHEESLAQWKESRRPVFWRKDDITEKHLVSYSLFMENDEAFLTTLKTFLDYGIVIVTDVPKEKESVEKVATRIGPIRETFFGRSWDVVNIPKAHNIAYTAVNLGLHQDLPYFESVPPVQILHCLVASEEGGESVFVDSYLAAERLKKKSLDYFETLLRVPITMQYTNNDIGVNFSPQNHGPLSVPPKDVVPFYAAYQQFSNEIYSDDLIFSTKLRGGDLVIFDNRRVLHGRKSFNPTEPRHLRGTYLGMDEVEDKYNTLKNNISPKT